MCLSSGQRGQTVKSLNIKNMVIENGKCTLFITRPLSTTKPEFHQSRSSHPEAFLGKGVLKICSKFTGEHPCRSAISIKLLCKNTSGRLLLSVSYEKLRQTYESLINVSLAARNHIRQSSQARLAGGAKSYLGKPKLILKSIRYTQQDQPPQVKQKLKDYL